MREQDGTESESKVHHDLFVAKGSWEERGHEARVAKNGGSVAERDELGKVGTPVADHLFVGWLSEARSANDLSMSHQSVQWLGESRADEEVETSDIEPVAA